MLTCSKNGHVKRLKIQEIGAHSPISNLKAFLSDLKHISMLHALTWIEATKYWFVLTTQCSSCYGNERDDSKKKKKTAAASESNNQPLRVGIKQEEWSTIVVRNWSWKKNS